MGTKKFIFRFNEALNLWEIGLIDSPILFKNSMGIEIIHYLLVSTEPWNITMPPFMKDGIGTANRASIFVQDEDPNYLFDDSVNAWTLYNNYSYYTPSKKL